VLSIHGIEVVLTNGRFIIITKELREY